MEEWSGMDAKMQGGRGEVKVCMMERKMDGAMMDEGLRRTGRVGVDCRGGGPDS